MEDISNFFTGAGPSGHSVEHNEGEAKVTYDRKMLELMKKLNFHGREKVHIMRDLQAVNHASDINYEFGVSKESVIPGYDGLRAPR